MLLAPAERLRTIGGRKNGKPNPFKRPLQKASKVIVVFDYQDSNGTMAGRFEVKPLVRRLGVPGASYFKLMHDASSKYPQGIHLLRCHEMGHPVHHADGPYRLVARSD